eukprot:2024403-Amphidinium_carterae.1
MSLGVLYPQVEAVEDGLHNKEILCLAKLGTHGLYPNHIARDLVHALKPSFELLPPMDSCTVPVQVVRGHDAGETKEIQLPVQYPHDIFAHYSARHDEFREIFGTCEVIESFWARKNMEDPAFARHPLRENADYQRKCIPVKLHSDAAVLTHQDTLHIISWGSFFGSGKLLEAQLFYTALVKQAMTDAGTDELYKRLAWSFSACLWNQHPVLDWDNNPWPEHSS